jgi:hypothetical protein
VGARKRGKGRRTFDRVPDYIGASGGEGMPAAWSSSAIICDAAAV